MATTDQARIEMRVDTETKLLAERASVALGCASLTEFVTRLIREKAPEILEQQNTIHMMSDHFDQFVAACNNVDHLPSDKILVAARRLDSEGY